ncbi:alpha-amylase family glycosyl hydrolase [Sciscionella sediminilitoris]|uniref:alpha-amylase family glycosyl hydrolase n=1 Tax=Sciscionella sediminilitoris TaxID=1445613 RepID=UPI000A9EF355|nr:alpha-amylase family glycosyl hydrolase [Sciscionella sp. SE31]
MGVSRRSFMAGAGRTAIASAFAAPALASPDSRPQPGWLADAVLYQIYPQSFADSNGDGIGDLAGIADHLDHLSWLGVTAVWLNPVFVSPFTDAGYDVADYLTVAPRYGTNEDLARLVGAARKRGIRVLLDLVVGHTSDQHPWFRNSLHDDSDRRYIWASPDQLPGGELPEDFVPSPGPRKGAFRKNFYATQPAINFGYARPRDGEPWREPVDAEGPKRNRAAVREIMAHWLDIGVSGFRCDMAFSLVKDDPGYVETGKLWNELRGWLDRKYPDSALIAEWGDPATSIPGGFNADFLFHFGGPGDGAPWKSLWKEHPFFGAEGTGTARIFVDAWEKAHASTRELGYISLPTANHDDADRLNNGVRTRAELPAAFAFWLTWPTVPAIYYGEEIGMRMLDGLPDKEGSNGRQRNRTPMQWNTGANAGFSTAAPEKLYLPIDPDPGRPDVAGERAKPGSLLNFVHRMIALRKANPEFGALGSVRVFGTGYPLTYLRGDRYLVTVNPRRETARITVEDPRLPGARAIENSGTHVEGGNLTVHGFGYAILDLNG